MHIFGCMRVSERELVAGAADPRPKPRSSSARALRVPVLVSLHADRHLTLVVLRHLHGRRWRLHLSFQGPGAYLVLRAISCTKGRVAMEGFRSQFTRQVG